MIGNFLIVSNNPEVLKRFSNYQISFQHEYLLVLLAARNAIHQGHHLLMHPESGSVKPGQTPYRSLLLNNWRSQLDVRSLEMIENAIVRYHSLCDPGWLIKEESETVLKDFQLVDLILLRQALEACDRSTFAMGSFNCFSGS
ncbi:GrdX family protein [Vibrio mimicus]|uniref:GrdX family protein n=1 Tax=Vibrio mimicus TaxID=674 RepID=UPI002F93DE28